MYIYIYYMSLQNLELLDLTKIKECYNSKMENGNG